MNRLLFGIQLSAVLVFATPAWSQAQGPFETTSLLHRQLYALPDDGTIRAAQQKLAADPKNVTLILALSKAQAARRQYKEAVATCTTGLQSAPGNADLLLERGHRELGLRQFPAAQTDLERAAELNPKQLDNFYHLGLAYYFQAQVTAGDFGRRTAAAGFQKAADSFRKALNLAQTSDSVIDCSNWLYVSLRRAADKTAAAKVLERITPDVQNKEPHLLFYLKLLHFYKGELQQQEILPPKPASADDLEAELAFNTISYGLGNWHLYNDQPQAARALFQPVLKGQAWNSWGFIGSELDSYASNSQASRLRFGTSGTTRD